jgi:hypothetical protein
MSTEELVKHLSETAHIREAGNQYGGDWTKRQDGGNVTQAPLDTKPSGVGRSLDQFVDDDEDIYEMYQRKINERPLKKTEDDDINYTINKSSHTAEMPRFEEYLNQEADHVHPFDRIADEANESLKQERADDNDYDKELHERELMGRLMGEKITPRQFELLTGRYRDGDEKLKRFKDHENEAFLARRDQIRLLEEALEGLRRQKVSQGEWQEHQSHKLLQDWLVDACDQIPGPEAERKHKYMSETVFDLMQQMENPESLMEKEYHFDEGLG